jgi:hypothetical protein
MDHGIESESRVAIDVGGTLSRSRLKPHLSPLLPDWYKGWYKRLQKQNEQRKGIV